jgi:hypothetical protein
MIAGEGSCREDARRRRPVSPSPSSFAGDQRRMIMQEFAYGRE